MKHRVTVVGGGLAGCEAADRLTQYGIEVDLIEMKPTKMTPAHHSTNLCELVCSNSLRGADISIAPGLLKEELRRLGSLVISCADATAVPAGGALAVDRDGFAALVTKKIRENPLITIIEKEQTTLPDGPCIVASGPLTSDALFADIRRFFGDRDYLHFYDAAAPTVTLDSVDMASAYIASRYDKGTPDYINCPLSKEEYDVFWDALCTAEEAPVHGFEDKKVFEGCMPVEVMGRRGHDTLLFGPLKPVGLRDPKTGRDPYAVVQLRRDNAAGSIYNLVGFQTHLKFGEQKRVFSLIPALKNAEYVRYGVMHRNSFMDSPRLLNRDFSCKTREDLYFAGQMTGVEGYVESIAAGYTAGINMARRLAGQPPVDFPKETAIGALGLYISDESIGRFQPMNINFGIITPLGYRIKGKKEKNTAIAQRALEALAQVEL